MGRSVSPSRVRARCWRSTYHEGDLDCSKAAAQRSRAPSPGARRSDDNRAPRHGCVEESARLRTPPVRAVHLRGSSASSSKKPPEDLPHGRCATGSAPFLTRVRPSNRESCCILPRAFSGKRGPESLRDPTTDTRTLKAAYRCRQKPCPEAAQRIFPRTGERRAANQARTAVEGIIRESYHNSTDPPPAQMQSIVAIERLIHAGGAARITPRSSENEGPTMHWRSAL
jgi:hypothetical protein